MKGFLSRSILKRHSCSTSSYSYWLIDSFTRSPFRGNPASILYTDDRHTQLDEKWMQQMANEINSPVTGFLQRIYDKSYNIRWFTPTKELELCGHATIAAAHVLYNELHCASYPETISFSTKYSGVVSAIGINDNNSSEKYIELTFPSVPLIQYTLSTEDLEYLSHALGKSMLDHIIYCGISRYDIVVVLTPEAFFSLPSTSSIDFPTLHQVQTPRGIIVTCIGGKHATHYPSTSSSSSFCHHHDLASSDRYDFLLRMFLPRYGINEDAVSGSAFATIGSYWSTHLQHQGLNHRQKKLSLVGYQHSERGGEVIVSFPEQVSGGCVKESANTIGLAGCCRTIIKGSLRRYNCF